MVELWNAKPEMWELGASVMLQIQWQNDTWDSVMIENWPCLDQSMLGRGVLNAFQDVLYYKPVQEGKNTGVQQWAQLEWSAVQSAKLAHLRGDFRCPDRVVECEEWSICLVRCAHKQHALAKPRERLGSQQAACMASDCGVG